MELAPLEGVVQEQEEDSVEASGVAWDGWEEQVLGLAQGGFVSAPVAEPKHRIKQEFLAIA